MKRKLLKMTVLAVLLIIITVLAVNHSIKSKSQDYIIEEIENAPRSQVAIVLGALVYQNETMSDIFQDRVDTGLQLYQAGKVDKILVSGDHGQVNYDEVNAAKDYLLDQGVAAQDIFMDHAGFDTYDSLFRAREIFKVNSAIVVTQEFHLPRAVYLAREMGIDAYGVTADKQTYLYETRNKYREKLASIKAWLNVIFHSKPKYLGDAIPITGDGQVSWD